MTAIYHRALPHVYGYLLPRCGNVSIAEDLVAETFLAAVATARQPDAPEITVAWLVGVARLSGHGLTPLFPDAAPPVVGQLVPGDALEDPWDDWLDTEAAYAALRCLPPHQRAALTLRYLDGLPVAEVAEHLGRSVHATETLLVRSRAALRRVYQEEGRHGR